MTHLKQSISALLCLLLLATPVFADSVDVESEAVKFFVEGNLYSKQGKFEKAITAYQKSIKIDASLSSVHYNLANIYIATDRTQEAIDEYQAAIELDPLVPDYHRNLGYAFALNMEGEKAKQKYDALKIMSPRHAEELLLWINAANAKPQGK